MRRLLDNDYWTGARLGLLATVSIASTIFVLAVGAPPRPFEALQLALAGHRYVVHVPRTHSASTSAAAPVDTSSGDGPAVASDPAPAPSDAPVVSDPVPSGDGGGTADLPPASPAPPPTPTAPPPPKTTKVKHVFVIALAGPPAARTFAADSAAPYLANELRPKGTLLTGYSLDDAADLPNYVELISGQPPNGDTRKECPKYVDFKAGTKPGEGGFVAGDGCVYPVEALTVADQMTGIGRKWKAYVEDVSKGGGFVKTCRHPDTDQPDPTAPGAQGDGYVTRHNPFAYFHSLLDVGGCTANDVDLPELTEDLKSASTLPNLAFVVPNLCHDGTVPTCSDGTPGGLPAADAFLKEWVPKILAAPGFRKDGMLVITIAGHAQGVPADTASTPSTTPAADPDSAPVGTLVISPFAAAGGTFADALGPLTLLRTVEDLFGLTPLAGAANAPSLVGKVLKGV